MALGNCGPTSNITRDCRDGSPGLVQLYVTPKANATGTITSASGIITNVASFLTTGTKFFTYDFEFGKANEVEVATYNTNGTVSVAQTLNLYIPKKQASIKYQLTLLGKQDCIWMIKDKNGAYRLLGKEFGMRLVTNTAASGAMGNDDAGYTLVFSGEERELADEVSDALKALLIVAAP